MKKLFLAISAIMAATAMNAQTEENAAITTNQQAQGQEQVQTTNEFKPEEGKFLMEIGYVPFSVTGTNTSSGAVNLPGGLLRGVYVLSESVELKLGFGVSIVKDVDDNAKSGDQWAKTSDRTATFSIEPGFNYCFEGTNRLEPYIGAELQFGINSTKSVEETQHNKNIVKNETGFNTFGVAGAAGFNFFVAKNLFVGAEVKLGVEIIKDKKTTTEQNGTSTKEDTKNHEVNFFPQAVPAIRVGWAF